MIERIDIDSFAVAHAVSVELHPGLNVFTGETGAGKSIIAGALDFALGARRGREVIATGADRASVSVEIAGGETVVRTVGTSGRTSTRLNGESVRLEELRAVTAALADIHGQSEQISLLRSRVQLDMLDEYAETTERREQFAARVRRLRSVRRDLAQLTEDARHRERLIDRLQYEIDEISSARLHEGEDEALRAEVQRLGNAANLIEDTERALLTLDDPAFGAVGDAAQRIVTSDSEATTLLDLGAALEATAAELGRELRNYREGLDLDPERLEEAQARLDAMARLRRKYGDSLAEVLRYEQEARKRLANQTGADAVEADLRQEEATLLTELSRSANGLSSARRAAASKLTVAVMVELQQLGMQRASFAVGFSCDDDSDGLAVRQPDYEVVKTTENASEGDLLPRSFNESGVDAVEFLVSFNVGEGERPLAQVASGGETSRFMLALTTALGATVQPRTIVLDEVDEGVGGRVGTVVGQALRRLARRHQVICITHLPQVAVFGDAHFAVTKTEQSASTKSDVVRVSGEERNVELALMLGGDSDANRAVVLELLEAATAATS